MKAVWKYQSNVQDDITITTHRNSKFLHAGMQNGKLTLWLEVDTTEPVATREFIVHGTGHPVRPTLDGYATWLATVRDDPFVWHIYEAR